MKTLRYREVNEKKHRPGLVKTPGQSGKNTFATKMIGYAAGMGPELAALVCTLHLVLIQS